MKLLKYLPCSQGRCSIVRRNHYSTPAPAYLTAAERQRIYLLGLASFITLVVLGSLTWLLLPRAGHSLPAAPTTIADTAAAIAAVQYHDLRMRAIKPITSSDDSQDGVIASQEYDGFLVTFWRGGGTCSPRCSIRHFWVFLVSPQGEVRLLRRCVVNEQNGRMGCAGKTSKMFMN